MSVSMSQTSLLPALKVPAVGTLLWCTILSPFMLRPDAGLLWHDIRDVSTFAYYFLRTSLCQI